jgi:hypothetical protein
MVRRTERSAEIEAELAKLRAAGAAASAEVEESEAKLATCEVEKDVLAAIARSTAARNRLRAIETKIDAATTRLDLAIAAERQALLDQLRGQYGAAVKAYTTAAKKLFPLANAMMKARERLCDNFGHEHQIMPNPPVLGATLLVEADLLEAFEQSVTAAVVVRPEPARAATIAQPDTVGADAQTVPKRVQVRLYPPPPSTDALGVARIASQTANHAAPPRRAPLRETPAEGERLFMLHRGLLEHPRKGALQAGDAVGLRPDEGAPLIAKGAGDWVSAAELAAIDGMQAPQPVGETGVSAAEANEPPTAADAPAEVQAA